jgi:glycosyltransferase involved in cell wall biosynthesis
LKCLPRIFALRKEIANLQKQLASEAVLFVPHHPDQEQGISDSLLLLALRKLSPRLIVALASPGLEESSKKLPSAIWKRFHEACRKVDLVIVPSLAGRTSNGALADSSTVVAPVGLPDPWEDGPRRERNHVPFLLYSGPVTEEAGVGLLIEACRLLKDRGYQFRCRLSGPHHSDEALAGLKKKAAEVGDWITFSGPVTGDARWDLFAETDIYCSLANSSVDPFGIGVIEAMMCGLPVVASQWGTSPELVNEGKSGFLVPAGDAKAASDRLAKLLKDQLLRQIMGNSGRNRYLDQYTLDAFRYRWESAIAGVLPPPK